MPHMETQKRFIPFFTQQKIEAKWHILWLKKWRTSLALNWAEHLHNASSQTVTEGAHKQSTFKTYAYTQEVGIYIVRTVNTRTGLQLDSCFVGWGHVQRKGNHKLWLTMNGDNRSRWPLFQRNSRGNLPYPGFAVLSFKGQGHLFLCLGLSYSFDFAISPIYIFNWTQIRLIYVNIFPQKRNSEGKISSE